MVLCRRRAPLALRCGAMNDLPRWVDSNQAAEILCVPPGTLAYWRETRRGPAYYRVGESATSRVRYKVSDLIAWMETRRVEPDADVPQPIRPEVTIRPPRSQRRGRYWG